jgi:transposase-like protein
LVDEGKVSAAPAAGELAGSRRWSAQRKLAVVSRLLAGESLELVSREIGVPLFQLEEWRDKAIAGMEAALRPQKDHPAERKLAEAQRRIGEMAMENELLRDRCRRGLGPLAPGRSQK